MNKFEQAVELHKQGKWQEAEVAYNKILQDDPQNSEVMSLIASVKLGQNKFEEALKDIDKALMLDQKGLYYQIKGNILAKSGKIEQALEMLNLAIKNNPNLYQSQTLLGHLFYALGNGKEAKKHFKMALKIKDEEAEAIVGLAKIYIDDGYINKGIGLLSKVEKREPNRSSVQMMLGQAMLEQERFDFAQKYFEKVLEVHPDFGLAKLYLGLCLLKTGDPRIAEEYIYSFNRDNPNNKEGIAAIGLLMFHYNCYQETVEYLKTAIDEKTAPLSWRMAYFDSLAAINQVNPAIDFYKKIEKSHQDKKFTIKLAELLEKKESFNQARDKYKEVNSDNEHYIYAILGITRCHLKEHKLKKAEKTSQQACKKDIFNGEAVQLYLTSLLLQGKDDEALNALQNLKIENYNNMFRKSFSYQHGMILDKKEKYAEAFNVFNETQKNTPKLEKTNQQVTEKELKQIQAINPITFDNRIDPVFIIGLQSTGINQFSQWLFENGLVVLNDRLHSEGRQDILSNYIDIESLVAIEDNIIKIERKKYYQKAKVLVSNMDENRLLVDCMYINSYQLAIIKKCFPKANVILLTRNSPDIWLNQKMLGEEPINSIHWNETKNQLISMGLNLTQIDFDLWQNNDKDTIDELSKIFDTQLNNYKNKEQNYWQKTLLSKDHWKNYQQFLGK